MTLSLDRLGAYVAAHAGLRMPAWVLEARVSERMQALGIHTCDDYFERVTSPRDAGELTLLVELLRVGETRFFRHAAQIKALTDEVLPALRRTASPRPIRVWSAGCASGEEPYTLAMLLALPPSSWVGTARVLATDLSDEALTIARRGVYPESALQHVPHAWRAHAFVRCDEGWSVARSVAKLVTFEQHNLTTDTYPRGFHLILCRNVLIYFEAEARTKVLLRLIDSLEPGGYLFVGYAESLRDLHALEVVRTDDGVLFRKPTTAAGQSSSTPRPRRTTAKRSPATAAATPARGSSSDTRGNEPAAAHSSVVVSLHGSYPDSGRLAKELAQVIEGPHDRVEVHLDGAEFLCDDAAAVLRRARAAARSASIHMVFLTQRDGIRRWMRRNGLSDSDGAIER